MKARIIYKLRFFIWRILATAAVYILYLASLLFYKSTLAFLATWYNHNLELLTAQQEKQTAPPPPQQEGERVQDFYN